MDNFCIVLPPIQYTVCIESFSWKTTSKNEQIEFCEHDISSVEINEHNIIINCCVIGWKVLQDILRNY